MKKWILISLAAASLNTSAATPQAVDTALAALKDALSKAIQRAPKHLQDSIGQAQIQWNDWATNDCMLRNGLAVSQTFTLLNEPFGSCMIDQIQRRTAQLNTQTKQ